MRKPKELRAISIKQPWAECIISKGKNVENRSWNTKFRGYVAIHASGSFSAPLFEYCAEDYGIKIIPEKVHFGAIVGFAELVDVITEDEVDRNTRKWFGGEYGFVLKNVIRLQEPVPSKGALFFWKLKGPVLKRVLAQLTSTQIKKIAARPLSK